MYKVFIDEKPVYLISLLDSLPFKDELQSFKVETDFKLDQFLEFHAARSKQGTLICDEDIKKVWKRFKKPFKDVRAAGGLVENSEGAFLFIFRNGKWDLPKGKMEKGEKKKETALREVEEECGISGHSIKRKLLTT